MAGCAQSARSRHLQKRYKWCAINYLRVKADKGREEPWRVGASFLKSDVVHADMQSAMGGSASCMISPAATRTSKLVNSRRTWNTLPQPTESKRVSVINLQAGT